MRPVWCSSENRKWKRISKPPLYEKVDSGLQVTFEVMIPPYSNENITYYFAYCVPYTYSDLQHKIAALKTDYFKFLNHNDENNKYSLEYDKYRKEYNDDIKNILNNSNSSTKKSLMHNPKYFWDHLLENDTYDQKDIHELKFSYTDIYFNHRVLTLTNNNLNLDLITISSTKGMITDDYENPNIENIFPNQEEEKIQMFSYCKTQPPSNIDEMIRNKKSRKNKSKKKVIFISARVHPGEVVSSYIADGIIEYLIRDNDIRAKLLRDKYVFKIVPMLNPEGVM
ncbi:hypothetical protein PIROE2DRAFT_2117 [Piromyces sp. E2]|nr:hypothetical protein PIROE2DRAFT_2117 [Piromyces sp. E2]|eukprot:OUM69918.1 hypothetical protein PIROE2DRAFT_2117 [Piromyces sp. E2]